MESNVEESTMETQSPVKPTIEIIRDYTETQSADTPIILVNPAHGNEPYILGTAIAKGVSEKLARSGLGKAKIVVPLMYGDRQKRILLEENPDAADLIVYDEAFGDILKEVTFGNGDFVSHLSQINTHYDRVEQLLKQRFSIDAQSFDGRSLSTNESVNLNPRNIVASIDTASKVNLEAPLRYFAFPILLSELLSETQKEGLEFDEAALKAVINRMIKIEAAYSQVFIPEINPLSYQYADDLSTQPEAIDGRTRIYTPAMKTDYQKTHGKVSKPGIYVMFSGTGSNTETTRDLAKAAQEAGLTVYSPPWVAAEGAIQVSPDVLTDDNVLGVFGRAGWGTGWQVQNLALPWVVTPYESGDDPEIYFNNKTIEALGLGKVLSHADLTPERLTAIISQYSTGFEAINRRIKEKYGTLNGIDFIADAIATDFLSKK